MFPSSNFITASQAFRSSLSCFPYFSPASCGQGFCNAETLSKDRVSLANQIALNWLPKRLTVANAIIGARNENQLRQNLGAMGWNLTKEQETLLDAASKTSRIYPYWYQHGFSESKPFLSS